MPEDTTKKGAVFAEASVDRPRREHRERVDDADLLCRYAVERSEAAFAELVRRHLNLVYSVALRQVAGDAHLAEDVTQQVFTALACKAAALADRPALSGWLYRSAHFAASDVVRVERRRRAREQEVHAMNSLPPDPAPPADWEKIRPVLDAAIAELDERDRDAVALRFFDGRSFADVGASLRLTENAARMRVERALDKLHALLAKRGVTSTASALGVALANQAAATAPAGMAASVTGAALGGAAAAGAGSLAAMVAFMSASKITVSLAAVGALAIGTAVYQSGQAGAAAVARADATRTHAALVTRRADLERDVMAAERELAERNAALARQPVAKPNAPAATELSPEALAALAQKARYDEAWTKLERTDPNTRELRVAATRARSSMEYRPLFQKLGFTSEQCERACDLIAEDARRVLERRAEGTDESSGSEPAADCVAAFRDRFGPAAAEQFAAFEKTRFPRYFVTMLSARTHFLDEPYTAQQAEQLVDIIANNWSAGAAERSRANEQDGAAFRRRLDWNAILAQAGTILSPTQLQGLRSMAAQGRLDAQLAAAKNQAASRTK